MITASLTESDRPVAEPDDLLVTTALAQLRSSGYPLLALVVAMVAAAIVSILFAVLVVLLRVNQVIAGLSLVFFCQGFTNLVGTVANWSNRTIPGLHTLPIYPLSELPVVGRVLFSQDLIVYLTIPMLSNVQGRQSAVLDIAAGLGREHSSHGTPSNVFSRNVYDFVNSCQACHNSPHPIPT